MAQSRNSIIKNETIKFISDYKLKIETSKAPILPEEIENDLMEKINNIIEINNANLTKGRNIAYVSTLNFAQIADIINGLYDVIKIPANEKNSNEDTDILAIYIRDGKDKGIYSTSESTFRKIAYQFDYTLTDKDFREIMNVLRVRAKRKTRCTDQDLIAVNNGIFDYKNKKLLDFDPKYVFLAKSRVNYNDKAINVNIFNKNDNTNWNVEDWMNELSDDKEIVNLLWEILGAIVRPYVSWDKSAWLYSTRGMNGKGTLCELMRNLCGDESYASIPVSSFGERFQLEPLTRATAIIVDENDVGSYIDKAANLKAVVTNDIILIDRKHKEPIPYQFHGFMVQCMNEFPRFKDKTDSFYRRQLFIPMDKQFRGRERKYIKDDYLHRPEVLEYVLYKVLNMNYYQLSEPAVCQNLLDDFKNFNDPVREFFYELEDEFKWDLLPFTFLFDLYKKWFTKNQPSGTQLGRNSFIQSIRQIIESDPNWACSDGNKKIASFGKMDEAEPLILAYGLDDWKSNTYRGNNPDKICKPFLNDYYRGVERINREPINNQPNEVDNKVGDNSNENQDKNNIVNLDYKNPDIKKNNQENFDPNNKEE